ncbi:MAG TPA: glycosyltransferase [Candidatus Binatia bacterium]|nr:glycosyltransferase [Candidatus Binatia bacterium]
MSEPLISVIMPCYNHARFLPEAVESVQAQNYRSLECIIVNDGSSDNTAEVAISLLANDSRIRLVNQTNGGLAAARNRGLCEARGELVHFLDADDYILPEMYARMAEIFQRSPDVSLVYSGYQFVNSGGSSLKSFSAPAKPADVFHELLEHNLWPCHAIMVRKSAIDSVGYFAEGLQGCEDWDLWLRLAAVGTKFASLNGTFACYRRLSDSMSSNGWHMIKVGFAVIERNSHWHKNCRLCKSAAIRGRKRWCGYCGIRVRSELRPRMIEKSFVYLALFLRIARVDLRLSCWMLSILFRKLIRLAGLGGTKSSVPEPSTPID